MMLKYILLGSAMIVAAPAVAQDMAAPQAGAPSASTAAPQTATPAAPTTATPPADPAATTAQTPGTPPAATDPTAAAPAQTADAAQPAGGSQVSSIVETEFASYDKDSSGSLSKKEFAAWMDALKAKAPAGTETASKPDPKWNEAAFKQADGDKSKSVSKEELASFLSGAANAS
jgi:EF hand